MLNPEKALELARRLTVVANFPTYSESTEAIAEDLVFLTKDCLTEDVAEARARWLIDEIRHTWKNWSGIADLIALYRKRFDPPRDVKSEDNEVKDYGAKPPIHCYACNDSGVFRPGGRESKEPYRWCECQAGITLHFDLPDWLDILNRYDRKLAAVVPVHPASDLIVSEETEKAITSNPKCPVCAAGPLEVRSKAGVWVRHTHSEYWTYHTKQEIADASPKA